MSNQIKITFIKRRMSQANQRRIVAETRQNVDVHYRQCQTAQFKVLRSSVDRHFYDSEFQIEGALTVNAFTDIASVIFGTNSNNLSDERNVRVGW